jgi:hypothetical protein
MRNARNRGEMSGTDAGEPGGGTQASGASGQTSPNAGGNQGPSAISAEGKYVLNPNKPNEVFTGEQILAMANRGLLLDQTQSKLQKTEGLLSEREQQLKETAKQLLDYRTRVDEVDTRERIMRHLREIGVPVGKQQTASDDEFNWPADQTGGGNPLAGVSPEKLLQALKSMTDEAVSKAVSRAEEIATKQTTSVIDTREADRERQRRTDEFVGREYRSAVNRLIAGLPDVSESKVQEVAKLRTTAGALEMEARDLVSAGKIDEADKLWVQAQQDRDDAFALHGQLQDEQRRLEAERERKSQIDMISSGGPADKRITYPEGPTRNKREARKRAEERLQKARELEAELAKYRSP